MIDRVNTPAEVDVFTTQATEALADAKDSQKYKANPHVAEGIKDLKQAIEHRKMGHADVAMTHAQEALKHLEMALSVAAVTTTAGP